MTSLTRCGLLTGLGAGAVLASLPSSLWAADVPRTPNMDRLAAEEPARTGQLWEELQRWLEQTGAKLPQPYAGYATSNAVASAEAARALKVRLEKEHAEFLKPDWQPDPTWWKSLVPKD